MHDLTHEERLQRIKRSADYPLTIFLINPINRSLVRFLAGLKIQPNAITVVSLMLGLVAAVTLFYAAQGHTLAVFAAPILVFLSHLCDALDGDLARYTQNFSSFGASMDPIFDRIGEFAYIVGVSWGVWQVLGDESVWLAGLACLGFSQIYYFVTDAHVARVLEAKANDVRRYSVTAGAVNNTRIKLGLYEPFMYGLAVGTSLGLGYWMLWLFAGAFGAGVLGQLWKLKRITG